jgi:FAD/FMN-containing dehydrogenase/Fe-S oxidoreductase
VIPLLKPDDAPVSQYVEFLAELRARGFEGDVSTGYADRMVQATDNSIYQRLPQAIVFPRHATDVVRIGKLAAEERFGAVTLVPRGGGTGTNGQSLTDGLIVDMSRHMNRILAIDPEARWAWVEAGVVKDQLNEAVKPHGLFFAPELSPSNRATVGGMIATDASGQGSVLYGKTRNHVLELKTVLTDGTYWHSHPIDEAELAAIKKRTDRVGEIHRLVDSIDRDHGDEIEQRLPRLNRCVTGYDLAHIRDEEGRFNLNAILCGAEGTLGLVTEAKINLVPIPRFSALVNIRYATFDAALRDARTLMTMQAASSETLDGKVLGLAREDSVWLSVKKFFPDDPEGAPLGVNVVELLGDDEAALEEQVGRIVSMLESEAAQAGRRGFTVARDHADILAIWSMRKKSVGLLGNMQGEKRPIPFVEDTVVPPENLADYIAEFRAILDRHGLVYGMFGHVDAGCLHVRPAIDMKDAAQEPLVRAITDQVFALTGKYKGVLWGEHGKGVRSEYAPQFFGPLYPLLQKIKSAFDPRNQLNPGKIAAPEGKALLKIDGVPTRGQHDRTIPMHVRLANADSLHCNGNAACYNFDPHDAMCPSWKATRERRHSPKGRASLMREWLRLLAREGSDSVAESEKLRRGASWIQWPRRVLNALNPASRADFSHAVKEAMDGCLACKSCSGQCPIKVDVPTFRSRFLELYHGRYPRPLRDYLVAALEFALPWVARAPWGYNALAASGLPAAVGLVSLPRIQGAPVARTLAGRGVREATPAALAAVSEADRRKSVVIVQDAFTTHFEGRLVVAFCELLQRLGFQPWLAPYRPNGKPMHVLGFLKAFQGVAERNAGALQGLAATGVPLVGLDPSMSLTYRFEYAKELRGAQAPKVMLPQEFLSQRIADLPQLAARAGGSYLLMPHCTERTNAPGALAQWPTLFRRFGLELKVLATGCCGMAGLYGHEARNRATSKAIYAMSWAGRVADPDTAGMLLATGYSCRSQVAHIDGVAMPHPIQVLLAAVKEERLAQAKVDVRESADFVDAHHEEY